MEAGHIYDDMCNKAHINKNKIGSVQGPVLQAMPVFCMVLAGTGIVRTGIVKGL